MAAVQTNSSMGRWFIIAGFLIACAAFAGLIGASVWQSGVHDSKADDAAAFTARATLLEEAGAEGQAAAQLLQTYVEQGDETLLPQVEEHSTVGVQKLTTALAQEGASDVSVLLTSASNLVDGVSQVVTLRQSGDVLGAAAALDSMAAGFDELTETQTAAIQAEQNAAAAALSDADSADSAAASLLYSAIGLGVLIAICAAIIVARAALSRQASERESTI